MFPAGRPSIGLDRYARATIVDVDATPGRVGLLLADGRHVDVGAAWLAGAEHGQVVPPVPQLLSGRGPVYVVGGRRFADRHLGGKDIHHYVTVDVGDAIGRLIPGARAVGLQALDRWLAAR